MLMGGNFFRMLLIFIQPSPNLPSTFTFVSNIPMHSHSPTQSGKIFSLMMADKLGDYIAGTAVETIETEKLIKEFEHIIVNDVYSTETPIDKVTNHLHEVLQQKGTKINTMTVDNVYNETPETKSNTNVWHSSKSIADARQRVSAVRMIYFS
jgi:hypothetical protein